MKYSKKIQLKNLEIIQNKILSFIPADVLNGNTARYIVPTGRLESIEYFLKIPELKEELINLGLIDHIHGIALNITNEQYTHNETVHIDSKDNLYSYSFNIPITGYNGCSIKFYKMNSPTEEIIERLSCDSCMRLEDSDEFVKKEFTLVESISAETPIIINTKVVHSFDNFQDQLRVVMLIRLLNSANNIVEHLIKNS